MPGVHALSPPRHPWYWRLRRRITPGLRNAQYAYFAALESALHEGDRWLDLGCGRRLAPVWMRDAQDVEAKLLARAGDMVGIDPDDAALTDNNLPIRKHQVEAETVPEPDAAFDLITANMVFEHLESPGTVLTEAARLLRPGGHLLIHTPNRWYPVTACASVVPAGIRGRVTGWLEKRAACDIYPTRYRMNSTRAIHQLARQSGLEVVSIHRTADSPETIRMGPLVAPELALIALTRWRPLQRLQSNLIVTLRKPQAVQHVARRMKAFDTVVLSGDDEQHYGDVA